MGVSPTRAVKFNQGPNGLGQVRTGSGEPGSWWRQMAQVRVDRVDTCPWKRKSTHGQDADSRWAGQHHSNACHGSETGSPREQEQVTEGPSRDPDSGTEPGCSLDSLLLQLKVVLGLGASPVRPALLGKGLLDWAVLPQAICSILRFHNNHVLLEIIWPP